jgi:hypothetical protein
LYSACLTVSCVRAAAFLLFSSVLPKILETLIAQVCVPNCVLNVVFGAEFGQRNN